MKILTFFFLVYVSFLAHAADISAVPCNGSTITWDFSDNPKLEYRVESWSREKEVWERNKKTSSKDAGNLRGLAKGNLFRVVGCDSNGECESSKAIWLPVLVCKGEQTEANLQAAQEPLIYIDKNTGKSMRRQTHSGYSFDDKVLDHNINLAIIVAHSLGDDAPMMEKPAYVDFPKQSLEDVIRFNVWYFYEEARTGVHPDISGTGYEFYF